MNEPLVLGGPLSPLGWSVGFVEAPLGAAVTALTDWWKRIGSRLKSGATTGPLLDQLRALDPLESGYTRHLLIETRGEWTACFDNSIDHGDQASWCAQLALELDVSCVLASHVPAKHYPYPSRSSSCCDPRESRR